MEGSFKSFDPLAYRVNNVSDLDRNIVKAYKTQDQNEIRNLISNGQRITYDVFICINNNHNHAFLLVVPADDAYLESLTWAAKCESPFDIPDKLLCWQIDLRFEEQAFKTYKIARKLDIFENIKATTKRTYYIARYKNVQHILCIDLAILRAAPHTYNVIIGDCVEFSKEFCIAFLAYCDNYREIENLVKERIAKASITGLSVENLSRNFTPSGLLGNSFLGGTDVSSFFLRNPFFLVLAGLFILLYPIIVSLVVVYVTIKFII